MKDRYFDEKEALKDWADEQIKRAEIVKQRLKADENIEKYNITRGAKDRQELKEKMLEKAIQPYHFFKKNAFRNDEYMYEKDDDDEWQEVE